MNLLELSYYLQNEEASKNYLLEKGILKNFTECPYCGSDKIGSIRRDRKRCYKCKKEWHQRKGSFLESRHISYSRFIGLLKLFCEELTPVRISKELEIEKKSAQELYARLRKYLIGDLSDQWFTTNEAILFVLEDCILLREKKSLSVLPDTYLNIVPKRYKEYGSLYSFLISAEVNGTRGKNISLLKSFLSYVKMKSLSYYGISEKYFWEYLNELILKFNNRENDYYEIVVRRLSNWGGG